jgi:N-acetyl-gamma-glutamyl-phosphate reductase
VHSDLRGQCELSFVERADCTDPSLDVLFLALPHGEARRFFSENKLSPSVKVIDLSNDFRLKAESSVSDREFIYGLPELNRERIRTANSIANPGCFASAIQFALLPLAKAGELPNAYVTGVTGSTGAGVKLAPTSHFSHRANNISAYKTLAHQHNAEIEESLSALQGPSARGSLSFVPWRGDFTRGIFITAQMESKRSLPELLSLYRGFYEGHPFISVTDETIDLKSVVNTNRVLIELCKAGDRLAVSCAIDNLLKGASGQAVQNLNLMMGFPETTGLLLKGSAF